MPDKPIEKPRSGSFTPQDLSDLSKHQHARVIEEDKSPHVGVPGKDGGADQRFESGQDMLARGERSVGESAGPDTTGAVAPPAERNRPGAATKLGGTPSANATGSGGRDTDY